MASKLTKAMQAYRDGLVIALKHRRANMRSGSVQPIDQNGAVIMQSSYDGSVRVTNTVSILATRGANGELTRMIHLLEEAE